MNPRNFDPDHREERNEPLAGSGDDPSGLPRQFVSELRALPRWTAPSGPGAALTFAAVMERVDESRLDARLAAEAPAIRRLLQEVREHGRLRAPASLTLPGAPAPLRLLRREPARMAAFAAAAAAAALMAATLLPALADGDADGTAGTRGGKSGLAAQTAVLTGRPALAIEVRYVDPRPEGR